MSLLTAGCFFGAIAAAFLNERIGRRYALMFFCSIFMIGAAVQTSAHHSIGQIYGGRVIAGLGIGGMSAITPVFVSENCPPAQRGRIAGLFQEFLVIGSTFAYWLDYGVALHIPTSTKQWRVPVGIQLIPGGLMLLGLFFLKESPRWLVKKGRHEEALKSLAYIRCEQTDSPDIVHEMAEIRAAVDEELHMTEGVTWKECIAPGVRMRFITGFVLMLCQQFSGTNSIGYYAPEIFQTVGVSKTNASLFATGVYGTVKIVATGFFLIFGIDRIGRRNSLLAGAAWMAAMMFILGSVLATHPPNVKDVNTVSSASIAMVVMIYLYVIGYSASWGPVSFAASSYLILTDFSQIPWVYLGEIFPNRLRGYGVGMGAATQWLFNFCITEITPSAINHIGYRTFIMFGVFCLANFTFAFFFIKETKGRTLESMDVLFGAVDSEQRDRDVGRMLEIEKGFMSVDPVGNKPDSRATEIEQVDRSKVE